MEMNRAEMAAVDGVPADLLDAQGRLVITPNAVTLDGQRNVPADLLPGESLSDFLGRHVPGIESGAWTVMIAGAKVPQRMWAKTFPKHGMLIACRASVGKQVIAIIAIAVLAYFTMGASVALAGGGTFMGLSGAAGYAALAGVQMVGSMLINKVLAPKPPSMGGAAQAKAVYSLNGQRNSARPYEPLPTLWGEMRVTPDAASLPYTWFEGDDQYLSTILLGGINVHSAADLAVGDTSITNYTDVDVFHNGFSGMPSVDVPLYSNADSISGAELENNGAWVLRTSSPNTIAMQFDFEGQLYDIDGKGNTLVNSVPLFIETRVVGSSTWVPAITETLTNATTDVLRRTFTVNVVQGQHEARVRLGAPMWNDGDGKDQCKIGWNILRSVQPDATDYSAWGRIGIKIKATGQLSGSLDTLRATYRARPLPVWNGTTWVTATTRETGLSNPGAILLQTIRGVYANGVLQFGFGMADEQIDIEGLKSFMLHCTANGYTYDKWITSEVSLGQFCQDVALAGMGEFSWTDGSRPTAVFVSSGQPLSGVVNMANMLKASFEVAYNLSNAADGIEYQFLDRNRNWETTTLRVAAPGVTTMLNPARITGDGVTTEAHAAVMARYHLAQSLYQYKTINYTADIEHLDYRRLSVLSVSHDLTQWGFGGRLVSAQMVAGRVQIDVGEDLPALPTPHIGLRLPGDRDYRVWPVDALTEPGRILTLQGAWPAGVPLPGEALNDPAHDTLWCYDFKATPGYRVRVVSMEPESDLKGAKVTCVPEGPEFWDYVINGNYVPAPNGSSLPQLGRPTVLNLRISEQVNIQGDTEWYELNAVWDVEGEYDHAQVWAGRDGSELRLVDGNAMGTRSTFRIDGAGEWLVQVRPFNASGMAGQSATVLYITSMTQIPPRNVDVFVVQRVDGGLRRFAWLYNGDQPPAFAGVQIRYKPGDVPLSVADWDTMQPLGDANDVYRAQFETTRPQAGLWTFGCRAIDTAGQLANGIMRFAANLGDVFDDVQQPDFTPPPTPTGFALDAALINVFVEHDVPTYTVGHGHAHTVLYGARRADGAPAPVFANAEKLDQFEGQINAYPTDPATTWHMWITWVTVDGIESLVPAGGVNGLVVTTGQDVSKLVKALTGPGKPFTIIETATTLPDGTVVPPGTYTADAYIHNGQITNAKIGNLAVDNAKIANLSVSKLLAGSMLIGQYIRSADFVSGSHGWAINGVGNAEFQSVTMRGTVYASEGSIGGILMHGSALYSANYAYNISGFSLGADGSIYANNVQLRGALMGGAYSGYAWPAAGQTGYYLGAGGLLIGNGSDGRGVEIQSNGNFYAPQFSIINGNASFAGSLSAASGTFSGTLTALAVNAVNTINIAGQTVTTLGVYPSPLTVYEANDWRPMAYAYPSMPNGGTGVIAVISISGAGGSVVPGAQARLRNLTSNVTVRTWDLTDFTPPTGGQGHRTDIVLADPSPAVGSNTYVLESRRSVAFWQAEATLSLLVARR